MAYFTRSCLLVAVCLCCATVLPAQGGNFNFLTGVYIEPECLNLHGTNFFVGTDVLASQERYVAYQKPPGDMPPDTQFFRRSIDIGNLSDLDIPDIDLGSLGIPPDLDVSLLLPLINLLRIDVYGRLRATESSESYLMVRVNEQDWFTFQGVIEPTDDFEWIAAPMQLPGLRLGVNTIDIAILQRGTQLDKVFLTLTGAVPSGKGGEAFNCGDFDFEPNLPPMAVARSEPTSGPAPLTVQLDGSDSFDDDGTIVSYAWSWEDGGSASGPTPMATFAAPGTYNVALTVTDDFNATDTDTVVVTVTDPAPEPTMNTFWLEAECATVGEAWETVLTEQASANQAVSATTTSRMAVPDDVPANRVRFAVPNAEAGMYSLFARVNAPDGLNDSYYVRINDGEWYSWSSGFPQGQGYRWKQYPDGPITLEGGTNFIDFAFREAGTELDKLHLNMTGEAPPVTSFGDVATNCDDQEDAATVFALEAECGIRGPGMGWQPYTAPTASNDKAMVYVGLRDKFEPVNPDPKRTLTFTIDVTVPTTYYGFVRLNAPDVGSNSFWLQVDGGDYILMGNELDGSALLTNGFEWRTLADAGTQVSFDLGVGPHTVTIVHRESNTRLDKLLFRATNTVPQGLGRAATNCTGGPPPVVTLPGGPELPALKTAQADAPEVSVYPNPTTAALTLDLTSGYAGRVVVRLTDFTGRQLRNLAFDKAGDQLRETLDVSDLAPGMYQLQLLEGDRMTVRQFVKQ
ncbi:hypothetical protein LEM8419_00856 [Neolewinella maritima]|uniref:PKD domain-containing protein n=1 Tax=Neolewinella maritima TaxID=1383882 RepID=A0ABN8F464_9BACT|nr:PKD domain-containing protein [Neolewinella maritima]CAH0999556.1 hypothetical protein LEM8419_00856 [Neolewinella maritima]